MWGAIYCLISCCATKQNPASSVRSVGRARKMVNQNKQIRGQLFIPYTAGQSRGALQQQEPWSSYAQNCNV